MFWRCRTFGSAIFFSTIRFHLATITLLRLAHQCPPLAISPNFFFNASLKMLLNPPGNKYPVETCTSMPSLLSLPSCDFTFPLHTCTANPNLFTLPQCSGKTAYHALMHIWKPFQNIFVNLKLSFPAERTWLILIQFSSNLFSSIYYHSQPD